MRRKWKDARGETLVEVMASILIAALSAALLFSAVMASNSIDRKTDAANKVLSDSLKVAEGRTLVPSASPTAGKVTIKNKEVGVSPIAVEVPVDFYGGERALSFVMPSASPTPTPTP